MKIFNNFVTINTEEDVRILGGCTMNKLALGLTTTALTAILALGAGQEVGAANTVSYDSTAVAGVSVSIDTFVASQEEKEAEVTEKKVETKKSPYANIAIAKVDNSVNIRKKADESSEVVGKLYKGAAGTVVKKGKVWTKIKSGSVTGYVKNTYLVYGSAAEKYANQVGTKIATVNTTTLKVRNKRSISKSEVVTLVPIEEKFEVLKEYDKWVRLSLIHI